MTDTLFIEGDDRIISKTVLARMKERNEIIAFPVRAIHEDFHIEIEINGSPRIYRVARGCYEQQIEKGDILLIAIYETDLFTISHPYAFRHPGQDTYFKL